MKKNNWIYLGLLSIVVVSCVFLINKKQEDPCEIVVDILSGEEYTIEGDLVFWGEQQQQITHVVEWHSGDNFCIKYPNKIFEKKDGNLYFNEQIALYQEYEEKGIQDMVDRVSVISNLHCNDMTLKEEYNVVIPEGPGLRSEVECVCKVYGYSDEAEDDAFLRLYCIDNEPIALNTRDDFRFIFYIDEVFPSKDGKIS